MGSLYLALISSFSPHKPLWEWWSMILWPCVHSVRFVSLFLDIFLHSTNYATVVVVLLAWPGHCKLLTPPVVSYICHDVSHSGVCEAQLLCRDSIWCLSSLCSPFSSFHLGSVSKLQWLKPVVNIQNSFMWEQLREHEKKKTPSSWSSFYAQLKSSGLIASNSNIAPDVWKILYYYKNLLSHNCPLENIH